MHDRTAWARATTLALALAGCGDSDGATANPFGQNPTATSPATMSATDPATGTTGDTPTRGTTSATTDSTGATTSNTTNPLTTGGPTSCGDGIVDAGEECDDGNVVYMVDFSQASANSLDYVS